MAEVEAVTSSEDTKPGPLAAPRFVFGENMSGRIKGTDDENNSVSSEKENDSGDSAAAKLDDESASFAEKVAEKLKRRAEENEGSDSDEEPEKEEVTSPIKKTRKISFDLSHDDEQEVCKFKFRPSLLTEVANNLVAHNHGKPTSPTSTSEKINFKTFGVASSENNSTTTTSSRSHAVASPIAGSCGNYFQQFIPGGNSLTSPKTESGFVFGQNIKDRVIKPVEGEENNIEHTEHSESEQEVVEDEDKEKPKTLEDLAHSHETQQDHISPAKNTMSLAEAAQAYQDSAACPILAQVPVITGEESERNVLQMQCKLFVFSPSLHSWIEHGRGILRLNDFSQSGGDGILQSRLVVRTNGSLKVILNTKLWAGMTIERSSDKSVRLTAMDADQSIKVFLITSSPAKDVQQLYTAIERRVQAMKCITESEETTKQEHSPVMSQESGTPDNILEHDNSSNRTQHRSTASGHDSDDEE